MKTYTNKKAFTLVELLVVITIIGIMSLGLINGYVRAARTKVYLDAINEVDTALKEAHALAIASRAQEGARGTSSTEDVLDASLNPIGIYIPMNTDFTRKNLDIIVFQDNPDPDIPGDVPNNQFDQDIDEIIRITTVAGPATLMPMTEGAYDSITVMYTPPRADAHLYLGSNLTPEDSQAQVRFQLTNNFTRDFTRSTEFRFLKATGIHITAAGRK